MRGMFAAHADWSIDASKRFVCIARRGSKGWTVAAPVPVGAVENFLARLRLAAAGAPVALGVDFPIGLPRAYASHYADGDFPRFLRGLTQQADFFRVCAQLAEITPARPFYPARGIKGMTRAAHAAALGLADAASLSRACDRATASRPAGAPLFWTLGANQSGKAAIAAWRDMLVPALTAGDPLDLWPFAGPYRGLLAPGRVAVAETYPAEALRHLSLRLPGSKRRQADRAALADALRAAMAALRAQPHQALTAAITDGFGAHADGEDRFDSLLGVLCVINVLDGHRPDTAPDDPWLRSWEGWVLGQTDLPAAYPVSTARISASVGNRPVAFLE